MRLLISLAMFAFAGYGVWYFGSTHPELWNKVEEFVDSGSFNTLEVRYTADQIMESHRGELLKDGQHRSLCGPQSGGICAHSGRTLGGADPRRYGR